MKKILVVVLFVISFNVKAQDSWVYKDSLFAFKVKVSVDSILSYDSSYYTYTATSIRIYKEEKEIQYISVDSSDHFSKFDSSNIFIIADANFDGYKDIGLQIWSSTRLDREYQFWFYDKEGGFFQIDTCLNDVMNPKFNTDKKLVCTFYHSGGMDHGYSKYIWQNNRLKLVDDINYHSGYALKHKKNLFLLRLRDVYKDQGVITHSWLENGEMKETFTETEEVGIGPCNCE